MLFSQLGEGQVYHIEDKTVVRRLICLNFFEIHDINVVEEIYKFRCENQHIEREYLELRVLLQKAESEMKTNPHDQELQTKVQYLKKRLLK